MMRHRFWRRLRGVHHKYLSQDKSLYFFIYHEMFCVLFTYETWGTLPGAPPLCYVVGMVCLVLLSSAFFLGGAQKHAPHINIYKYRYPDLIIWCPSPVSNLAFGGQAFVWLCSCCCWERPGRCQGSGLEWPQQRGIMLQPRLLHINGVQTERGHEADGVNCNAMGVWTSVWWDEKLWVFYHFAFWYKII